MNKINKLITSYYPEIRESWLTDDNQKKVKKCFKTKREKTQRQTDEPKKHTPYINFCMGERSSMKEKFPDLSAKEITAKLGEAWNIGKEKTPHILQEKYGYTPK